ncbi:hypothetical protein SD71_20345 [Cohnella kolymensis]|uniref:Uncharacterized protein n=1 Tax=Cohnella kolymensis TaxID=1590652 RepID=A0ABR4ZZY5_9BACL|nr:hypothetical protein [Cohnella kolymensis]KIL34379.1 hypothetical protein SD71_20345 [Cohnella kolymensis]
MKKYWKWWLLTLAMALSWGGNLWVYESQKLEKPLFLNHYYELPASLLGHMRLYYIANSDSKREPYQFELPNGILLNVAATSTFSERGRLQLREAIVTAYPEMLQQIKEQLAFEQVSVRYNDGLVETVPIGKVIVHPDEQKEITLASHLTSGSNDGTGLSRYTVRHDVQIIKVSHSFPEVLDGTIDIEFNGRKANDISAFPMELRAGASVAMYYRFQLPEDDIRRFNAYQLLITYENSKGETAGTAFVNSQPELYEDDLANYVRFRKGEAQP